MIVSNLLLGGFLFLALNLSGYIPATNGKSISATESGPLIHVELHRSDDHSAIEQFDKYNAVCKNECNGRFKNDTMETDLLPMCIAGCGSLSIHSMLNQRNVSDDIAKSSCLEFCKKAYPNEKERSACDFACATRDEQLDPVETIDSLPKGEQPEQTVNDGHKEENEMNIPLAIPVLVNGNEKKADGFDGRSSLSDVMMSIMANMENRVRNIMDVIRRQQQQQQQQIGQTVHDSLSKEDDNSKPEDTISVQRSVSVLMTKDENGDNKVLVIRQPPRVTIHQSQYPFNWLQQFWRQAVRPSEMNPDNDGSDENVHPLSRIHFMHPSDGMDVESSINGHEANEALASKILRRLTFDHYGGKSANSKEFVLTAEQNRSSWYTFFCSFVPFLYVLLIILLSYLTIWVIYPIPSYFIRKFRSSSPSPVRIDTADLGGTNSKGILPSWESQYPSVDRVLHKFRNLYNNHKRYSLVPPLSLGHSFKDGVGRIPSRFNFPSPTGSTMSIPPSYGDAISSKDTLKKGDGPEP